MSEDLKGAKIKKVRQRLHEKPKRPGLRCIPQYLGMCWFHEGAR